MAEPTAHHVMCEHLLLGFQPGLTARQKKNNDRKDNVSKSCRTDLNDFCFIDFHFLVSLFLLKLQLIHVCVWQSSQRLAFQVHLHHQARTFSLRKVPNGDSLGVRPLGKGKRVTPKARGFFFRSARSNHPWLT